MEELDLKELISIFMKHKVLIIMVVVIFALAGAIYTLKFITPLYTSETTLVLAQAGVENNLPTTTTGSSSITSSDVALNSKLVDSYIEIATSHDKVLSKVIENLNLDISIAKLESIIKVTQKTDTNVIRIIVEHTDPELSCKIANELARSFVEAVEEIYKLNNLSVLDQAKIPQNPSNIHFAKNVVIFAFIGGILVSGYILLINMLDTTVKSDIDIERTVNLPVLASIVLTNDNIKKTVHAHADSIYRMSNIDNGEEYNLTETTEKQDSNLLSTTDTEEISNDDEYEETEIAGENLNNLNVSNYNNFRPTRKKNRNRRNHK